MDVCGGSVLIRPADLRKDWVWVKPLLEAVIAKTHENWLPEDVYSAVSYQKALMYVCDEPPGVLVFHPEVEAWTGDKVLQVWVCHAVHGMDLLWDEAIQLLDRFKVHYGAKAMRMDSPRPGWQKRGWKVKRYIYER